MTRTARLLHFVLLFSFLFYLPQFVYAQELCSGSLVLILSGDTVEIPFRTVSIRLQREITVQAYGTITEPFRCSVLFSLSFHEFPLDIENLDTLHCMFSYKRYFQEGGQLYYSFDFGNVLSVFLESDETRSPLWQLASASTQLKLSNSEFQNGSVSLAGTMTGRHTFLRPLDNSERTLEVVQGKFSISHLQGTSEKQALVRVPEFDPALPSVELHRTTHSFDPAPAVSCSVEQLESIMRTTVSILDQLFRFLCRDENNSIHENPVPVHLNDRRQIHTGRSPSTTKEQEPPPNSTRRSQGVQRSGR